MPNQIKSYMIYPDLTSTTVACFAYLIQFTKIVHFIHKINPVKNLHTLHLGIFSWYASTTFRFLDSQQKLMDTFWKNLPKSPLFLLIIVLFFRKTDLKQKKRHSPHAFCCFSFILFLEHRTVVYSTTPHPCFVRNRVQMARTQGARGAQLGIPDLGIHGG